MKDNVVLVTGGAGFLGSNLVYKLLDQNKTVVVYDNFFSGKREFLPDNPNLHIVEGDLNDCDLLKQTLAKHEPATVYHLAAIHFIPYCNAHPLETIEVNTRGTESVIQACQTVPLKSFLYASTAAVYDINDAANKETDAPLPLDIYGASKYFGEHQVRLYHDATQVPCRIARLFNIYGPNETNAHVLPAIFEQLDQSATIELGNLEPKRDYIYVEDVADAFLALNEHAQNNPAIGCDIFNVGAGEEFSVTELVDAISEYTGINITITQDPARVRKSDRPHLLSDNSKIQSATQWSPQHRLLEGMAKLIQAENSHLIKK